MNNYNSNYSMTEHKTHLDFLRIIAIFMVLFNHTQTKGFLLFTVTQASPFYYFYMFIAVFIKIAVPIFFMISGALLLPKEETLYQIFKNRILRFLIILIVCSFLTYLYSVDWNLSEISFSYFVKTSYSSSIWVSQWYLYAYLAYLLMLPFLRKLANALNNQDFLYMLLVYSFIQTLKIAQFIIWKGEISFNHNFSLFITERIVFWPMLGYYLENRLPPPDNYTRRKCTILIIAAMISICICCALTHYNWMILNGGSKDSVQTFLSLLIFIPAVTVYYTVKFWFSRHQISLHMTRILSVLGSCTFGIYLFEQIYRNKTRMIYDILCPYLHSLPACIIWILSACALGFIITWVLKHIPILNKFL